MYCRRRSAVCIEHDRPFFHLAQTDPLPHPDFWITVDGLIPKAAAYSDNSFINCSMGRLIGNNTYFVKLFLPNAHVATNCRYNHMSNPVTEPFLIKLQSAIEADQELSVSSLAVKAGLSNSAIRQMLKDNRSPRVSTMRKICAALGTTLEEFMSNAQTEEEQEIVRLISQLPSDLRHELLGFGKALAAQHRRDSQKSSEDSKETLDR